MTNKLIAVLLIILGLTLIITPVFIAGFSLVILALSAGAAQAWLAIVVSFIALVAAIAIFVRVLYPTAKLHWRQ